MTHRTGEKSHPSSLSQKADRYKRALAKFGANTFSIGACAIAALTLFVPDVASDGRPKTLKPKSSHYFIKPRIVGDTAANRQRLEADFRHLRTGQIVLEGAVVTNTEKYRPNDPRAINKDIISLFFSAGHEKSKKYMGKLAHDSTNYGQSLGFVNERVVITPDLGSIHNSGLLLGDEGNYRTWNNDLQPSLGLFTGSKTREYKVDIGIVDSGVLGEGSILVYGEHDAGQVDIYGSHARITKVDVLPPVHQEVKVGTAEGLIALSDRVGKA